MDINEIQEELEIHTTNLFLIVSELNQLIVEENRLHRISNDRYNFCVDLLDEDQQRLLKEYLDKEEDHNE